MRDFGGTRKMLENLLERANNTIAAEELDAIAVGMNALFVASHRMEEADAKKAIEAGQIIQRFLKRLR